MADEKQTWKEDEIDRNLAELNKWYRYKDQMKDERTRGLLVGFLLGSVSGAFGVLIFTMLIEHWPK
jgi:hypothetical protein